MDKIRIGVIGAGMLGRHHAETCEKNKLAKVVGVADVIHEAASALASTVNATAYDNCVKMLQAEKPDVAVIATPDPLHGEPFFAALDAGVKHLIMEKPLATKLDEAEKMARAAEEAGATVYVNFANRFAWLFMATHRIVQQDCIGRAVYGEGRLDDNLSVPLRLWGPRSREWASTSSTAQFLFPHLIDLLLWFYAPARVTAVQAIRQDMVLGFTPDLYDAFLHWDNGLKTRIKAEWIKHIEKLVEFYICLGGEAGSVVAQRLPAYRMQEGWRAMLDPALDADRVRAEAEWLRAQGLPVCEQMIPDPTCDGERQRGLIEMESLDNRVDDDIFLQAIAEGTLTPSNWQGFGPLPTVADGLANARIVAAVERSAETGETVQVSAG